MHMSLRSSAQHVHWCSGSGAGDAGGGACCVAGGGGGAGGAGAAAGAQGRGGGRRAGAVPAAAGTRNPPAAGSCTHMLLPGAPVGGSQVQRGAMQWRSHETAATPHMAATSGSGPHPHAWLSNTPAGRPADWLRCLTTDRRLRRRGTSSWRSRRPPSVRRSWRRCGGRPPSAWPPPSARCPPLRRPACSCSCFRPCGSSNRLL